MSTNEYRFMVLVATLSSMISSSSTSAINPTYLSRINVMELAPCRISATGCQGFIGPLPSAFLDK
jgi:hypothetical protein